MEKTNKRIVIALGGNALQRKGEASAESQQKIADETARQLAPLVMDGYRIVIVHGNGPQVGNIVIHEEAINTDDVPSLPLDSCVAMSQGSIGYWLQQALTDELRKKELDNTVVTLITQMLVDKNDMAFKNPSKPIGPFYVTKEKAMIQSATRGFVVKEDAGRGWRRVVPSPKPIEIIEKDAIKVLINSGAVVIAAGGGGVPVFMTKDEGLHGIEAVIDKDFSAAVLADLIDANKLIILTSVDAAMLNYGKPNQQMIGKIDRSKMQSYIADAQFSSGSMLPKVQAALQFVNKPGRTAVIASLEKAAEAVDGNIGTIIHF
ncbi:MAG: carbamate kinase [Patescibacteria group bacterium]|nr:carbamate kinase [Patescibacteria group bacterium]